MSKIVGIIGLGIMGGAIAPNLIKRGWTVIGYDVDAARADMLAWLLADPAHRKAYDKAARLLLLAGLVPARIDVDAWNKSGKLPGEPGDPGDPGHCA